MERSIYLSVSRQLLDLQRRRVSGDLKRMPFKVVADSDGRAAVSITTSGKATLKKPEESLCER